MLKEKNPPTRPHAAMMDFFADQKNIDSFSDGVIVVSNVGKIISVNKSLLDLGGYAKEELVGKNVLKMSRIISPGSLKQITGAFLRGLKGEAVETYEIQAKSKQGETKAIEISTSLIKDGQKIQGMFIVIRDLAKYKTQARELSDNIDFFKNLVNSIADPIFVKDAKHRWIIFNDAFCRFMGRKREEIINKSDYDFFPKSEADIFWAKDEEVFKGKKENINEENFTDSSGVTHTIITKKSFYVDNRGQAYLVGIINDITERKKAEERYRYLFSSSRDAIMFLKAPDWKFYSANEATLKLFGVKNTAEFEALSPADLSPKVQPDGQPSSKKSQEMIAKALKEGINLFDWQHKRFDGKEFSASILLTKMEIGGEVVLQALVRDITKEKELQEQQARLVLAIKNSDDAIFTKDLDGMINSWNDGAEKVYGYKSKEIIGKNVNLLVPKELEKELAGIVKQVGQGKTFEHFHTVRVKKDGSRINMSLTLSPIKDLAGKIVGISVVGRDITQQAKDEKIINDKISELEKINRLMIGRELKMIELKKTIESLTKKLNNKK